ncbi:MAG: nicotinamide mononucleotide transporter PnuC [Armatimonadetes bacterium]|nr:nicotinamide mononucleotide transporter PnuC [Armatimonadota bacterium]
MKRADVLIGFILGLGLLLSSWLGWLRLEWTEALGFVTGGACVYLVVREHIWNFPVGIANNVFFFVLFYRSRLYGDAWLQVVYLGLAVHGWYFWLHGGENRTARRLGYASVRTRAAVAACVLLGTLAMIPLLRAVHDPAPVLDAFTTCLSLGAQFLLNRKSIENWYLWITADVLYVYLYLARGLQLTAVLYSVFLCLCVAGLVSWQRSLRQESAFAAVDPGPVGGAA